MIGECRERDFKHGGLPLQPAGEMWSFGFVVKVLERSRRLSTSTDMYLTTTRMLRCVFGAKSPECYELAASHPARASGSEGQQLHDTCGGRSVERFELQVRGKTENHVSTTRKRADTIILSRCTLLTLVRGRRAAREVTSGREIWDCEYRLFTSSPSALTHSRLHWSGFTPSRPFTPSTNTSPAVGLHVTPRPHSDIWPSPKTAGRWTAANILAPSVCLSAPQQGGGGRGEAVTSARSRRCQSFLGFPWIGGGERRGCDVSQVSPLSIIPGLPTEALSTTPRRQCHYTTTTVSLHHDDSVTTPRRQCFGNDPDGYQQKLSDNNKILLQLKVVVPSLPDPHTNSTLCVCTCARAQLIGRTKPPCLIEAGLCHSHKGDSQRQGGLATLLQQAQLDNGKFNTTRVALRDEVSNPEHSSDKRRYQRCQGQLRHAAKDDLVCTLYAASLPPIDVIGGRDAAYSVLSACRRYADRQYARTFAHGPRHVIRADASQRPISQELRVHPRSRDYIPCVELRVLRRVHASASSLEPSPRHPFRRQSGPRLLSFCEVSVVCLMSVSVSCRRQCNVEQRKCRCDTTFLLTTLAECLPSRVSTREVTSGRRNQRVIKLALSFRHAGHSVISKLAALSETITFPFLFKEVAALFRLERDDARGRKSQGLREGLYSPLLKQLEIWAARNTEVSSVHYGKSTRVKRGWVWSSAGMPGRGKREIPEKTRRPAASSCRIPT
ncbi:hypothetical protein PR048_003423 [Dryococelus australis]|uniref:Uncharacterized protein n=1 Tax=Dryococelus australis TaxID=614101 RepID=A0ABQ9IN21_9NEOP|nr:hypothetical protein PR048_003423 [Dryococelus australis]